ncbi:SPFH domain-containing protein [Mycolicibacterium fortuitum]|uniref:SPFH domain-containing protein n=1 Tax=Mycolicibacterium fortuitum TaxID=1766 RepID=UPI00261FA765|nr:SPFH domain-containing protein [Mycolicibacterium fortuitum]
MFATIALAVLVVLTIAAAIIRTKVPSGNRPFWAASAAALGLITAIVFVLSTFVVVSTRNVGVVTTFGRPVGTLSNGLHFTWPWQTVEEMDGSIQIDWHKDNDPNGDNHDGAIVVRLGNNSNAWADTSVRWEMQQPAADDLFLQYKTFDNIRTNLVTRNLQTALNEVFASYNPLVTINPADPTKPAPSAAESQLPAMAARAAEIMQAKVGDQIKIYEVQIPTIAFDGKTQDRIDELNRQKAATAVAIESQTTADEQAKANQKIAASINNDPNVLVNKCLDIVREKGGSVLGCWPGANAVPTVPVNP